mmetsp:Transcript_52509/g.137587  ORF Transcript_52509/g.137587 Transcript_52509/m.137587 type:complete len:126 (+) Transcript_52509:2783-3160(+)
MSLFGPPKAGGAAAMGPPMMPGFGPGAAPRTGPTGHSFFGPPAAAGGGGGFGVGFPMAAGFGVGAAPLGGGFAGTGFGGQQVRCARAFLLGKRIGAEFRPSPSRVLFSPFVHVCIPLPLGNLICP